MKNPITPSLFIIMMLVLVAPLLAQAHLLTGIVTGPEGLVAGAKVIINPDGQPAVETFTDGNGEFSVDITADHVNQIQPEPVGEGSGLIGERVTDVDITGGRKVRLTLAKQVIISGDIIVPDGFSGELVVRLNRLDKWDTAGDWGTDQNTYHFSAVQAAGVYTIQVLGECKFADPPGFDVCDHANRFSYLPVDASNGNVTGLVIPFPGRHQPILDKTPPLAELISVGQADSGGIATIDGAPGTVPGPAQIRIVNLHTGQHTFGAAKQDGGFSMDLMAPPGTWVSVHQDSTSLTNHSLSAGTIIQVPSPGDPDTGFATSTIPTPFQSGFHSDSPSSKGIQDRGTIWLSGDLGDRTWPKSGPFEFDLTGTFRIYSRNAASINPATLDVYIVPFLERIFSDKGKQELPNPEFMSHVLTPTGLPIEKRGKWAAVYDRVPIGGVSLRPLELSGDYTIEAAWSVGIEIPPNLPDGIYRLAFQVEVNNLPVNGIHFEGAYSGLDDKLFEVSGAGLITLGSPDPPRLSWALGLNTTSDGRRGTVAIEDRDRLQIAGRVSSNPAKFIIPRQYSETGTPVTYRLEPFVPLVGASNRGWITPPTIPFKFPSGSLEVQIRKPDGSVENLGSAPFAQPYIQDLSGPSGNNTSPVSNTPQQYYSLTTLDPKFNVNFDQYGLHTVTMQGSIEDIWGISYPGGGTYEVYVARHLDIETGVFPHTPFEVGDAFSPTIIVQPGVAAKIEIEIRHYPQSDPAQLVKHVIKGEANRFGYYHPNTGEAFTFDLPGEYRFDVTVSFTDAQGVLWMGSQMWASVVETPSSSLITHGRRNSDAMGGNQQWLKVTGSNVAGGHLPFPYHNGDIAWMLDTEHDPFFTAHFPSVTIQDTEGSFANLVRSRNAAHRSPYWDLENSISIGQIPLFSSRSDGLSPFLKPNAPDSHMAYQYTGVSRPGVRIRDMVSEDDTQNAYWRFEDSYYYQAGVGINGDMPNDFKFQFGGAVYRAPDIDFYYYGAYGSLWVLLPNDDSEGTRIMPPFQGNAGGPSGGPIMTLKGQEIDMFFHPTGTRPGSILEVGDFASFAGQIGPTLSSQVSVSVTMPNESVVNINGQANKVGYFYDASTDFRVTQPGVYTVNVNVWHDGQTSAGPTLLPFPSGNVLGSNAGEFHFYVVETGSFPLAINGPAAAWVEPGLGPVNFTITSPIGWTEVELQRTTVMPGFIMEDVTTPTLTYSYHAPTLAVDFPNLDLFDADYRTGVDSITMSFLLSGMLDGKPVYRARQMLLQGEELMFPPQPRSKTVFINGFE